VTLADRRSTVLVDHVDALRSAYRAVMTTQPFQTVAICILPDHLHAIWILPEGDSDYSGRWNQIKGTFSRGFAASPTRTESKRRRGEKGIWQRRFWEHQIRDETDLARHIDYLHFNPVKHGLATRVQDWAYSSFHRFVRDGLLPLDWGSSTDDPIEDDGFGE